MKLEQFAIADVGSTVTFGSYEQDNNPTNGAEAIEWLVLAKEENRILVISQDALDAKPYNESYESVTWEKSTLRRWLNDDFLNQAFTPEQQAKIPAVTITNSVKIKNFTIDGMDTTD